MPEPVMPEGAEAESAAGFTTQGYCTHCGNAAAVKNMGSLGTLCRRCHRVLITPCSQCKRPTSRNTSAILEVWPDPLPTTEPNEWHRITVTLCQDCCSSGRRYVACQDCGVHELSNNSKTVLLSGREDQQRRLCRRCCILRGVATCVNCTRSMTRNFVIPVGDKMYCTICAQSLPMSDSGYEKNPYKQYVGYELEFIYRRASDDLALTPPDLAKWGQLKGDGSVKPTTEKGGYPAEFASRISRGDTTLRMVRDVSKELKKCKSYANRTCGFHVHVDMRETSEEQRENIKAWWLIYEPIFFAMVRQLRRKNSYCTAVKGNRYVAEGGGARYQCLNIAAFQRHRTYEWRLHHGTINPRLIRQWMLLILRFVNVAMKEPPTEYAIRKRNAMKGRQLLLSFFKFMELPLSERKYVTRRIRRFEKYVRVTEYISLSKKGSEPSVQHKRVRSE